MSGKIDKILNSLKGISQVDSNPYFYTRLKTRIEDIKRKEIFYLKVERPILITMVGILIAINLFFISNKESYDNSTLTVDMEEIYFDSEKSDIINLTSNEE